MKLSDFATTLSKSQLPVAYRAFEPGNVPELPYLVYFETSPHLTGFDDKVGHEVKSVTVELVFERKNEEIEERLEELWNTHQLFFDVQEEIYIDTERLHVKSYTVYLY
ncbi:hypothetical protein [Streptococcus anginosus]|uniref:hypothetical protein n=1 Tax=Streptococcus anginosus TaxID=1328 RepID=UPI00321A6F3E